MKNLCIKKTQNGYSAIELMLALIIITFAFSFMVKFNRSILLPSKAELAANQAYNYAQGVKRYITTHQNTLQYILMDDNDKSNGKEVTLSVAVLKDEGYFNKQLRDETILNQIPCTVIFWDNHQLQAYTYYRTDGDDKKLSLGELATGANHVGAMLGFYHDGVATGSAKDWRLDADATKSMFIAHGTADPSQGDHPDMYDCKGEAIANNSYVINITSILRENNRLPDDTTIHQYQDILHDVNDPAHNNTMNDDLNMHYVDNTHHINTHSNIVFQMNPNCQMDPTHRATMQDYDPNVDGRYYDDRPNSLGCRNLQLAIQAGRDQNGVTMTVTGFKQSGDLTDKEVPHPYVGELKAASIQPTAFVDVGTPCTEMELGKMARQKVSSDPNDVNNIYINQVQCMVHPLCPQSNRICYMPITSVSIRYSPNTASFECPIGTFIDQEYLELNPVPKGEDCNGECLLYHYTCWASNKRYGDVHFLEPYSNPNPIMYRAMSIDETSWEWSCPDIGHICGSCVSGWDIKGRTQGTIASVVCTNDPSRTSVIIQK